MDGLRWRKGGTKTRIKVSIWLERAQCENRKIVVTLLLV